MITASICFSFRFRWRECLAAYALVTLSVVTMTVSGCALGESASVPTQIGHAKTSDGTQARYGEWGKRVCGVRSRILAIYVVSPKLSGAATTVYDCYIEFENSSNEPVPFFFGPVHTAADDIRIRLMFFADLNVLNADNGMEYVGGGFPQTFFVPPKSNRILHVSIDTGFGDMHNVLSPGAHTVVIQMPTLAVLLSPGREHPVIRSGPFVFIVPKEPAEALPGLKGKLKLLHHRDGGREPHLRFQKGYDIHEKEGN